MSIKREEYTNIKNQIDKSNELNYLFQRRQLNLEYVLNDNNAIIEIESFRIFPKTGTYTPKTLEVTQSKFYEKLNQNKKIISIPPERKKQNLTLGIILIEEPVLSITINELEIGTFGISNSYKRTEILFYPTQELAKIAHDTGKYPYEIPIAKLEKDIHTNITKLFH